MIPLNKPGNIAVFERDGGFASAIEGYSKQWLFTAGDGLNLIYKQLYKQYGALRVAVSPLVCYQAILPIVLCGHTPILVDIDEQTLNMDTKKIPDDVDVIEVVHLGGNPLDMEAVMTMGKIVVEDCAQAMGAKWQGRYVGTFGQYAVYSMLKNFYKPAGLILGVNEDYLEIDAANIGGAIQLYKTIKTWLEERASYRPSFINLLYGTLLRLREKEGGFRNVVRGVRNTDALEEALLHIDALNHKRVQNAERIIAAINPSALAIQKVPDGGDSTWNRILMRSLKRPAYDVIRELREAGIAANNLTQSYIHPWQKPIWEDEMLAKYYDATLLPVYTAVAEQVVAIPNSPFLSEAELQHIETILTKTK